MDIVIGGTDTSSTTVEWAMAEMMLHPQVMKKAQEEMTNVVGINNLVEEFHIQELPYLHSIVKETLRLHPVAPLLLPRCPTESCNVGGYTIPKGTKVFLNVWAMHKDPEFWDHPSEFQPERFFGEGSRLDYLGNHLQYLPFGSGRRICAGLPLGERMVMYLLATFLHMFN
ncbi:flavonoid 3'-monooxygenase-like [Hevea brasiliensis]|uniref:flavonoid 3'-monooxygenase-like n=1 Tax=Hevea brasiliensis TaxID=3981 RepID=UPI0025DC90F7|nr:flavonoid 3'-monooxygenase-like [Hevea brasiliensis]